MRSSTSTNRLDDAIERDLFAYELLAQLGPKYEVMRRIVESVIEPSRKILVGNVLSSAINSNNPVDTMNKKLIDLREAKTSVMMLNDLATFYGMDKVPIKELPKLKFRRNE